MPARVHVRSSFRNMPEAVTRLEDLDDNDFLHLPQQKKERSFHTHRTEGKLITRRQTLISKPYYKLHKAEFHNKLKHHHGHKEEDTRSSSTLKAMKSTSEQTRPPRQIWHVFRIFNYLTRKFKKSKPDVTLKLSTSSNDLGEKIRVIPNEFNKCYMLNMDIVQQNEGLADKVARFAHLVPEQGISFAFHVRRIDSKLFEDVIEYSKLNKINPPLGYYDDEDNPMNGIQSEKLGYLPPTDWEFLVGKRKMTKFVISFLQAGTDMKNQGIVALCTNILALRLTGKTAKQMRRFLGVKNDLTREDWQTLSYENNFLIASDSDSEPDKDVSMMFNDIMVSNIYDHVDLLDTDHDETEAAPSSIMLHE